MLPSKESLQQLLRKIKNVRVAVIGDACLDVYWWADMQKSQLSRETPHYNLPISHETMSPGAAGNVALNAAALGCSQVYLLSLVGSDWRGASLTEKLHQNKIITDYLILDDKRFTPAYIKPMRVGYSGVQSEDPRIDFAPAEPVSSDLEQALVRNLDQVLASVDVILVADQLRHGCISNIIRKKLEKISLSGKLVIVDSRESIGQYKNMTIKPNVLEAWQALHADSDHKPLPAHLRLEDYTAIARNLAGANSARVCLTLGPGGCIWSDTTENYYYPAFSEDSTIDIVGAGDAFLAALGCGLAADAHPEEALSLASIVSNIIIHKTGTTGTATPQEIIQRYRQLAAMADPFMENHDLRRQK